MLESALGSGLFNALSLQPEQILVGEVWRLLTANVVHFGWAHTLMNVAALLLCGYAFFADMAPTKFLVLLLTTMLTVGVGVFWLNPEYNPYAGLSGAIHGLLVVGLVQSKVHHLWVRIAGLALIAGKLMYENSDAYEPTALQQLIPAAVAVESHLYGAIAGIGFCCRDWLFTKLKR